MFDGRLHAQALKVLRMVRGTQNVQLEYDDITTASKVAAQVPLDSTFKSSSCRALAGSPGLISKVHPCSTQGRGGL